MPGTDALNQISPSPSLTIKNQQLPDDLEKVVDKANLTAINFFSKIKAFFSEMIYGKMNSLSDFWGNVNIRFEEISIPQKQELYDENKDKNGRDFTQHVIYNPGSKRELSSLKKVHDNLTEYIKYKIKYTEEENKILELFVNQKSNMTHNGSNILINFNDLLSNENTPQEIKNLILEKLKKVPEYQSLKKNLENKKKQRTLEANEEALRLKQEALKLNQETLRLQKNKYLKKVALVTFVAFATLGLGYIAYNHTNISDLATAISDVNETVVETGRKIVNETIKKISIPNFLSDMNPRCELNETIVGTGTGFFDDIEIPQVLGRTSPKEVQEMLWKIGAYVFERPYEMTKKSSLSNLIPRF